MTPYDPDDVNRNAPFTHGPGERYELPRGILDQINHAADQMEQASPGLAALIPGQPLPQAEAIALFEFDDPPPVEEAGRTIPARRTDPDTSHAATAAIKVKAGSQRARLLAAYQSGDDLTDEEAQTTAAGVSPYSEFAKRCSELRAAGLIRDTGATRPGAAGVQRILCHITDAGREVLRGLA